VKIELERYERNPIMVAGQAEWESQNVSNAAAVVHDGKVVLLYRAEGFEPRGAGHTWPVTSIGLAVSENGFDITERRPQPVFGRDRSDMWHVNGSEDPRISKIGDTYYIVYVGQNLYGHFGDRLCLATTQDFVTFEKHGVFMEELEQRTSGLLPGKIDDQFVLFHRPMPNMWVSFSRDLKSWRGMTCVFKTRPGTWYEAKLGIGPPPIETDQGWLLFWHGKDLRKHYALGIMLLDKDDPRKIIKLQEEPILRAETDYEREGFVPNAIYTCGAVRFNDRYFVYYGCADRCLAVATVDVDKVERWCQG
jgi:predicted GH43/DUF377 family glycosyl hydrolase